MLRFNPTREECAVLDEAMDTTSWEEEREFISVCEEETLECECVRDRWSRKFSRDAGLGLGQGEVRSALTAYNKALVLDPDNFRAWFGLACAYFILSDFYNAEFYDRALGSLDGALSVQSIIGEKELFSALMLRSAVYFSMGDEGRTLNILEAGMPAYPPATPEGEWMRSVHRQIRDGQIKPFGLFGAIFTYFYLTGDEPALFVV